MTFFEFSFYNTIQKQEKEKKNTEKRLTGRNVKALFIWEKEL